LETKVTKPLFIFALIPKYPLLHLKERTMDLKLNHRPLPKPQEKTDSQKQAQELQRKRMEQSSEMSKRISDGQRRWGTFKEAA